MRDAARERFHHLLTRFSHGMLVTRTPDGSLRARPLAVAAIEENDDLWFVTGLGSGKVTEILNGPQVCVTFQEEARYLSLTGRAVIVSDEEKLQQLWKERWRTWFPDGPRDPQVVLLRVAAEAGEFWDRDGLAGIQHRRQGVANVPDERQKVVLQSPSADP